MEFEVIYYKSYTGDDPIHKYLLELALHNKRLYEQTVKGIAKLRYKICHTEPLSKYLESGLWELRIKSGTNILRIIYTFSKGRVIILLYIFIKKSQKTPVQALEIARRRMREVKLREKN